MYICTHIYLHEKVLSKSKSFEFGIGHFLEWCLTRFIKEFFIYIYIYKELFIYTHVYIYMYLCQYIHAGIALLHFLTVQYTDHIYFLSDMSFIPPSQGIESPHLPIMYITIFTSAAAVSRVNANHPQICLHHSTVPYHIRLSRAQLYLVRRLIFHLLLLNSART